MMISSLFHSGKTPRPLRSWVRSLFALACGSLFFLAQPGTAYGAAAGSVAPTPEARATLTMPPKPVETKKMTQPGLLGGGAARQDTVHLLFPNDGIIIPKNGVITLGWIPPSEEILVDTVRNIPQAYDIEVSSDEGAFLRVRVPSYGEYRAFSGMVTPPGPGKYQWQIIGIMKNGMRVASENRVFTVLP